MFVLKPVKVLVLDRTMFGPPPRVVTYVRILVFPLLPKPALSGLLLALLHKQRLPSTNSGLKTQPVFVLVKPALTPFPLDNAA